ncbi:hypothetical protein [Streptococcus penaeicida]
MRFSDNESILADSESRKNLLETDLLHSDEESMSYTSAQYQSLDKKT